MDNYIKKCSECHIIKSSINFYKNKNTKDGYSCSCKLCGKNRHKLTYLKNKDKIIARSKEYRKNNKERKKAADKAYSLNNKEKLLITRKIYRINNRDKHSKRNKKYAQKNKPLLAAKSAKYRCSKLKSTPTWLTSFDKDYIHYIYTQSTELEKIDGIKRHVDHIIPLQGKTVSGLHVPWNLQILTALDNFIKNNKLIQEGS